MFPKKSGSFCYILKNARRKQSPDGRKFAQSGRENLATSVIFNPKSTIAALAKIGENWRKLAESGHPEGRVPESVGIDVISM
jgi:hypothetical protein